MAVSEEEERQVNNIIDFDRKDARDVFITPTFVSRCTATPARSISRGVRCKPLNLHNSDEFVYGRRA